MDDDRCTVCGARLHRRTQIDHEFSGFCFGRPSPTRAKTPRVKAERKPAAPREKKEPGPRKNRGVYRDPAARAEYMRAYRDGWRVKNREKINARNREWMRKKRAEEKAAA